MQMHLMHCSWTQRMLLTSNDICLPWSLRAMITDEGDEDVGEVGNRPEEVGAELVVQCGCRTSSTTNYGRRWMSLRTDCIVYMSSLFQKGLLVVWGYLMYEYLKEYFEIIWCVNEFSNGQNHAALKESGLQSIASQQSSLLITDLLVQTNTNNVINILTTVTSIQSYRNSHTTARSSDTVTSLLWESRHFLAILVLWIMLVWILAW